MNHPVLSREELDARNAKILELLATNTPGRIAQLMRADYPAITRNVVIGIVQRQAPHVAKARQANAHKPQRVKRRHDANALPAGYKPQPSKPAIPAAATGFTPKPPGPPTPPQSYTKGIRGPIEGSTPVPAEQRTGCVWPFGDRGPLLFCNLPKCRVASGGIVHRVNYCAGHWDLRRASKTTRIMP